MLSPEPVERIKPITLDAKMRKETKPFLSEGFISPVIIFLNSGRPEPAACLQKYLMITADTIANAMAERK
jgi:hypothetical protein